MIDCLQPRIPFLNQTPISCPPTLLSVNPRHLFQIIFPPHQPSPRLATQQLWMTATCSRDTTSSLRALAALVATRPRLLPQPGEEVMVDRCEKGVLGRRQLLCFVFTTSTTWLRVCVNSLQHRLAVSSTLRCRD